MIVFCFVFLVWRSAGRHACVCTTLEELESRPPAQDEEQHQRGAVGAGASSPRSLSSGIRIVQRVTSTFCFLLQEGHLFTGSPDCYLKGAGARLMMSYM